jgi:hypothetical protein
MTDCLACTEACDQALNPCGHYFHIQCIIRTGKAICPACTNAIVLTFDEQEQLQEHAERIRRENQEQREQEDREVAINLARGHQNQPRRRVDAVINRTEVIFEPFRPLPRDELMMALFNFTYGIEQGVAEATVNRAVFRVYELTQELRELGIELEMETSQILDLMNLITSS